MKAFLAICLASAALLSAAEPEQLFDGRTTNGWSMVGPGRFVLEDGLLKTEGGMGLLWYTGRKIGNETLRVVFRTMGGKDNSGVYIRLPEPPTDPWYGVHNGFEVQIAAGGDEWHRTGSIYSLSRATKQAQKAAGEWNTMEIQFDGPVTRVTLNGEMVDEFSGGGEVPERKMWFEPVRGPRPDSGYIGLQNHDAASKVHFREISVIPTEKSPLPMQKGERDQILSYYHATRKQILDATADLSPEQWKFQPAADKWSVAQVVEHLALTEEFLFGFATSALSKPAATTVAKDQTLTKEKLVTGMTDRSKPIQAPGELVPTGRWQGGTQVVKEFRQRRDEMIRWLIDTKEPVTHTLMPWGGETVTVYTALHSIPAHTERHLKQINEVKANPAFPKPAASR